MSISWKLYSGKIQPLNFGELFWCVYSCSDFTVIELSENSAEDNVGTHPKKMWYSWSGPCHIRSRIQSVHISKILKEYLRMPWIWSVTSIISVYGVCYIVFSYLVTLCLLNVHLKLQHFTKHTMKTWLFFSPLHRLRIITVISKTLKSTCKFLAGNSESYSKSLKRI